MFETSRPPVTPEDAVTEFNRLYLEKCKEVNKLELIMDGQKAMLIDLRKELAERDEQLKEYEKTIRQLAAEPIKGFFPNVEPPEELPECLLEEKTTAQDILCLSSAIKNLYEIKKCDTFTLYLSLCKVLEKKIEGYCKAED